MTDLTLGIDAGSTVLKAAVFDIRGRQVAVARRRTPLNRPKPGWVEADPAMCREALGDVITEAVQSCSTPSNIRAIGICGAMVGAWLVDAQGNTIRPGINWEDSRSQPLLEKMIAERPTLMSEIFAISGSVLQQGCTLPILAWFKQNEPDTLARTAYVLSYKDVLRHQLTGVVATERSEAAVLPGDAYTQGRSTQLMELFGLSDLADKLTIPLDSLDTAGQLTAAAANRTGLKAGIPVVAGAGDVIANVIGAGGLVENATTAILGTTCMVGTCLRKPVFTPPDLGLLFSLPEKHWYRAMVNVAGTLNLDWMLQLIVPEAGRDANSYAHITELAESCPPGANGVTYLPYLSESGIIAPVINASARAQICGLHGGHNRADIIRSVFEGVAFALADLLDLLETQDKTQVTLTGGGSRSQLWCQMIADITGCEIVVPKGTEFGARGAALLGAVALGSFDSIVCASAAMTADSTRYRPDTGAAQTWQDARTRYIDYRERLLASPDYS